MLLFFHLTVQTKKQQIRTWLIRAAWHSSSTCSSCRWIRRASLLIKSTSRLTKDSVLSGSKIYNYAITYKFIHMTPIKPRRMFRQPKKPWSSSSTTHRLIACSEKSSSAKPWCEAGSLSMIFIQQISTFRLRAQCNSGLIHKIENNMRNKEF